jgi:hypothetical protein
MTKSKKIVLSVLAISILGTTNFLYADSGTEQNGERHRKVFTTTTIGGYLTKSEREAIRKQKEEALATESSSKQEVLEKEDNISKKENDNRSPIEKIVGKNAAEEHSERNDTQHVNPIVEITNQAPVITDDMRRNFQNSTSGSREFKPNR